MYNYISLVVAALFVLIGAFLVARGDPGGARAFFIIGILATVFAGVRIWLTLKRENKAKNETTGPSA